MGVMWRMGSFILFAVRKTSEQRCAGEGGTSPRAQSRASPFCRDFGYDPTKGTECSHQSDGSDQGSNQKVQIIFKECGDPSLPRWWFCDLPWHLLCYWCSSPSIIIILWTHVWPNMCESNEASPFSRTNREYIRDVPWPRSATTGGWLTSGSRSRCVFISRLVRLMSAVRWKMQLKQLWCCPKYMCFWIWNNRGAHVEKESRPGGCVCVCVRVYVCDRRDACRRFGAWTHAAAFSWSRAQLILDPSPCAR